MGGGGGGSHGGVGRMTVGGVVLGNPTYTCRTPNSARQSDAMAAIRSDPSNRAGIYLVRWDQSFQMYSFTMPLWSDGFIQPFGPCSGKGVSNGPSQ